MAQPVVHILRGLPGSGKSTRAAELHAETGAEIVNRDALRMALLGSYWTGDPADEAKVTLHERSLVVDNLSKGRSVIIDATHLVDHHLIDWYRVAEEYGASLEVITLDVGVETCVERDRLRGERGERWVGEDVIRRMALKFPILEGKGE